jgi:O-antigen/teichoic acid export membrane protein
MAFGRSLFYIWEQSDKFFAGRVWNSKLLGYYSFALQLAQIPTEKIVVLINQVAFPAFSKLIDDKANFNQLYLNISKITATIVLPLFVGGYLVGEDIIKIFLNEQWFPMIFLFKYLCLSQIMMAMNAINNFAHAAQGRPHWGLCYNIAGAILMPVSFYLAVPYGLNFIIVPWFTTFIIMCSVWILTTIKKLEISLVAYIKNIISPFIATAIMIISVYGYIHLLTVINIQDLNLIILLASKIAIGALCYIGYLWLFNRTLFYNIKKMTQ